MKFRAQLSFVAFALLAAGCHPGPSVVGKWQTTLAGTPETVEFTSDSKMTATGELNQIIPVTVTVVGTYTLDKDVFNIKATDITAKPLDASKQAVVDRVLSGQKQSTLDKINADGANNKVAWKSDDEFVVTTASGKQQTFTRIKA